MTGLIFVGMVGPDSHNREEQRFVEELSRAFGRTYYLRGAGVKGLRLHQLQSLPARLRSRSQQQSWPNVWQGSLLVFPFRRLGRRLNTVWIRRQLEDKMRSTLATWTLWIRFPTPELVDAVQQMRTVRVIYEPIDLYSAAEDLTARERSRITQAEQRLIQRAIVVTGGRQLADRFRGAAGGSNWLVFGRDCEQPDSGAGLPRRISGPRLGLVGCLDWRVDESLLVSLMKLHPNWQLILAGPRVSPWGRRLKRLPNVHWLGRIPVNRVLPIIRDLDVALIPYRITDWTRHCLPIKVFEYLSEGKPVVATPLPELGVLRDVITASPVESFSQAVELALLDKSEPAKQRRRETADRFTLQERTQKAAQVIDLDLHSAVTG